MDRSEEFSIKSYIFLLKKIKENYMVIDYELINKKINKKTILIRHDIDVSLHNALELAKVEHDIKIKSTYFIWIRSPFYNCLSNENVDLISKIIELGHDIGLHFDPLNIEIKDMDDVVKKEVSILEEYINKKVSAISFHQPPKNLVSTNNLTLADLPQVYSEEFFNKYEYYADSNCKWSKPISNLYEGIPQHVQLLVHPVWWTNGNVNYRYRVINSISNNRLHDEMYHLKLSGLFNER